MSSAEAAKTAPTADALRDQGAEQLTGPLPLPQTDGSVRGAMDAASQQGSPYAPAASCATCPERSLRVQLGWTFYPNEVPAGSYQLSPGMAAPARIPANGRIILDQSRGVQVPAQVMRARLTVNLDNGPSYQFDVSFDLPAIQEPAGLQRRLTNLGLYAGNDAQFGGRMLWALRAFKRIHLNGFARNSRVPEDDMTVAGRDFTVSAAVMAAVQTAHGAHPGDRTAALTTASAALSTAPNNAPDAGMFGPLVLQRGSYEVAGGTDDSDPRPGHPGAVWNGQVNPTILATRPDYLLCLGAYNEKIGEAPVENRVNLPQPIHMLQLALFETGFWLVAGPRNRGRTISAFGPTAAVGTTDAAAGRFATMDGGFGRGTQWALREFQGHAKMPQAAVEDVSSSAPLYLQRIIGLPPAVLSGPALYADTGRVSGALNDVSARTLQSWLDHRYRCPVLIYAGSAARNLDVAAVVQENLWRYNDYDTNAPRMYALDLSANYTLPAGFNGTAVMDGHNIPQPVTVGGYTNYTQGTVYGGQLTQGSHLWKLETTEVTPQTIYGTGGLTGAGLSATQLSTFKVVRAAAHFECLGHFDAMNAYDRVTLSFGLCHWTLAVLGQSGRAPIPVQEAREMGALFSYLAATEPATWQEAIGRYGMAAARSWPIPVAGGAYTSAVTMQTETDAVILCGANYAADRPAGIEDNHYGHLWPLYYRMLMANRTNSRFQIACGRFARQRIVNILGTAVGGSTVGSYLTSEKAVAMAYRAHIYTTGSLSALVNRLGQIGAQFPTHTQAREELAMTAIEGSAGGAADHVRQIRAWVNLPQNNRATPGGTYSLNLDDPTLSGRINSFQLDPP